MESTGQENVQQVAKCPNCNHQGKYWYRSLREEIAVCHVCETPLNESNILIR